MIENKLGQRQSQTPFSSTFRFLDQNSIFKVCNLICSKIFVPKKIVVQKIKNFGTKNIFSQKKNLVQEIFFCKKKLAQKTLVSKVFGQLLLRPTKVQFFCKFGVEFDNNVCYMVVCQKFFDQHLFWLINAGWYRMTENKEEPP